MHVETGHYLSCHYRESHYGTGTFGHDDSARTSICNCMRIIGFIHAGATRKEHAVNTPPPRAMAGAIHRFRARVVGVGRPPALPAEVKLRIVMDVLGGRITVVQAAREHRVGETSVGNWKRQFIEAGCTSLMATCASTRTSDIAGCMRCWPQTATSRPCQRYSEHRVDWRGTPQQPRTGPNRRHGRTRSPRTANAPRPAGLRAVDRCHGAQSTYAEIVDVAPVTFSATYQPVAGEPPVKTLSVTVPFPSYV